MNSEKEEVVGLKGIIVKYLHHWRYFVVAFCFSLILAILYLVLYPKTYAFMGRVQIQETGESAAGGFGLGEAAGIMKSFGLGAISPSSINIDDEIAIFQSSSLFVEMVRELGLNIEYTRPYSYYKLYHDSPILLTMDSLTNRTLDCEYRFSVSMKGKQLKVKVKSKDDNFKGKYLFDSLPATIEAAGKRFTLHAGAGYQADRSFSLKIKCLPTYWVAEELSDKFNIEDVSKSSNMIELNCDDHVIERGKDMLNMLIRKYNEDALIYRQSKEMRSLEFVDQRIHKVMEELLQAEKDIELFKERNKMTLFEADVEFFSEQLKELKLKIVELETENHVMKMLKDYIKDPANRYKVVPSLLSVQSGEKGGAISLYNETVIERDRLLKNSNEHNLAFQVMSNQVDQLRESVFLMIENGSNALQLTLNDLKSKENMLLEKMKDVPKQEREFIDYKRKQEILQGIYLVLLQKKEEALLSLGNREDRARVVDAAFRKVKKVAPRGIFALLGLIALTLILPVIYLFVKEMLLSLKEEYRRTK